MKFFLLLISITLLVSCGKTDDPRENPGTNTPEETNTVDIGNKPIIEITESQVQPIR